MIEYEILEDITQNFKRKEKIKIPDNNESELIKVKTLTDSQLIIETTDKYTEDGIFYEDYELTEYRKI